MKKQQMLGDFRHDSVCKRSTKSALFTRENDVLWYTMMWIINLISWN